MATRARGGARRAAASRTRLSPDDSRQRVRQSDRGAEPDRAAEGIARGGRSGARAARRSARAAAGVKGRKAEGQEGRKAQAGRWEGRKAGRIGMAKLTRAEAEQ